MPAKQAEHRIVKYAKGLTNCGAEAAMYGKCVATKTNLKKDDCLKEFNSLRKCVMTAMKK